MLEFEVVQHAVFSSEKKDVSHETFATVIIHDTTSTIFQELRKMEE
jgi:hypothetical protein